ncbi:MAG TPA: HAD family hydrolase [Actinomycetota bacterium]|nr:HAD family hydrolase [Actinomycetota bacterium]
MDAALIVDVDGTLVDSAYEHVLAWSRAFRAYDVFVPSWRIHRAVGMGGDQLIPEVAGQEVEDRLGERIREIERDAYADYLPNIPAFPDAIAFLEGCRALGAQVVLSSSAKPGELDRYLELLDAERLGLRWTNSDDVSRTKPHPDLIHQALQQVPGADALMIGDATWDVIAASRAGVSTIGLLTGGYGEDELRAAGALEVYPGLEELTASLPGWVRSLEGAPNARVAE